MPRKTASPATQKSGKPKKKKTLRKKLFIIFLVIATLTAAGLVLLLTNLNYIVKTAIEKVGSRVIQTSVNVEDVNISLKEGSAYIGGLTISNIHGFTLPLAFSLGGIKADIDLKSLNGDVLGIEEIIVESSEIFMEINTENENNLDKLRKNLPRPGDEPDSPAEGEPILKKGAQQLFIRRVLFTGGRILVKSETLNKEFELKMPYVEMLNLRGTPDQIASQILHRLTGQVLREVRKKGLARVNAEIDHRVNSQIESQERKAVSRLKNKVGF